MSLPGMPPTHPHGVSVIEAEAIVEMLKATGKSPHGIANVLLGGVAVLLMDDLLRPEDAAQVRDELPELLQTVIALLEHERDKLQERGRVCGIRIIGLTIPGPRGGEPRIVAIDERGKALPKADPLTQPPLWLCGFNLEAMGGRGSATLSYDARRAKRFATIAEAQAAYRGRSVSVPTRPDGQPNRPLTAYSVSIEPLDD